jgi:hypothetical protein
VSDVRMTTINGVRLPLKREDREYRPVPGTPMEVSQLGNVRQDGEVVDADEWPYTLFAAEDGIYRIHLPEAVATIWLTDEQREEIRRQVPSDTGNRSAGALAMTKEFQVWLQAVLHVARKKEVKLISPVPGRTRGDRPTHRIEGARVEDYKTFLVEEYRPPSKGGNTSAMHAHTMWIDGEKYSWWARGTKKWVFASDTATFDYYVTDDGYRNVLPHSVVAVDKNGKVQIRGDRRWKAKLRSAPTRLPVSRREARD